MTHRIRTTIAVVATTPLLVFTAGSASAADDGGVAGDVEGVLEGVLADLIRILFG